MPQRLRAIHGLVIGCLCIPLLARAADDAPALIVCTEPRPELCTQQYLPVCASRDTGIRCITFPCPAREWKQYPNACTACSDKKVYGYREGECPNSGK